VHLSTIVLTDADGTLTAETVGPEAVELNIALAHVGVGNQEPGTEDSLGQDIKNSVDNDLSVHAGLASTVGNTPDTGKALVSKQGRESVNNLHGVGSPEDSGVGSDGDEEAAELVTLGAGVGTTVKTKVPEDEEEGNARDGVPAPLLGSLLSTESSEQTSQDHDDVGDDHHDHVSTGHASKETEIEEQERGGDGPVDVTGPVDLAVGGGEGVGNVVVLLALDNLLEGDTGARGHGEVREGGGESDDGGDDMVEALVLGRVRCLQFHVARDGLLTKGTFQDMTVKAAEAMSIRTKTTQRVFCPASPATSYVGSWPGMTVGTGATEGREEAVAVGNGNISEVFLKTSSNWSTIMMAVVVVVWGTPG
jgi:hypothetical protein